VSHGRRQEKEKAIRKRFSTRMEEALRGLEQSIAHGRLKDRYQDGAQTGADSARHAQVNDLYEVAAGHTRGLRLVWKMQADREPGGTCGGRYMLRSNPAGGFDEELWSKYMQLTKPSVVSRVKSEAFDPAFFHQKSRGQATSWCVLVMALWVT